ncbi:hypothetical protein Pcinc_043955 [Petrolisthes cinctipes]|uniref:Uncharacterized protein n=1 Tax=Petrolisthes cinctipes TaxID=88211 RepID=A0AAE1EHC8_PETCI|nr:hypothetical protein Pcinc_043955 [Petrolisthes cinctipes]
MILFGMLECLDSFSVPFPPFPAPPSPFLHLLFLLRPHSTVLHPPCLRLRSFISRSSVSAPPSPFLHLLFLRSHSTVSAPPSPLHHPPSPTPPSPVSSGSVSPGKQPPPSPPLPSCVCFQLVWAQGDDELGTEKFSPNICLLGLRKSL